MGVWPGTSSARLLFVFLGISTLAGVFCIFAVRNEEREIRERGICFFCMAVPTLTAAEELSCHL